MPWSAWDSFALLKYPPPISMNQAWLGLHKKLPLDTPCFCKYLLDSDLWVTTVAGTISFIPPSHVWTIIPEICYSNLSHYATSVTTISMTITVDSGAASSVTFSKHRLWHISPPEAPHCRSGRLGRRPSSRQVVLTSFSRDLRQLLPPHHLTSSLTVSPYL